MKKTTSKNGIMWAVLAGIVAIGVGMADYLQPVNVQERQEFAFRSAMPSIALPAAVDGVITLTGDHSEEVLNITEDNVAITGSHPAVVGSRTVVQCVTISADNVTVSDIDVVGCPTFGVYITGKNATFKDSLVRDALRDGTLTSTGSSGAIIKNNTYDQNSQSCIEIRGTGHTIEGNNCSGTVQHKNGEGTDPTHDADCFRFFGSGHLFKNNYCHDITFGSQPTGTNPDPHIDGFQTWGDTGRGIAHDIVFDGNVIVLSGRGGGVTNKGVQLEGGSSNLIFRNNTFRTTLGSLCTTTVSGITFDHNTWVGDKTDSGSWGINANRCGNPVISNNIFAYHPNGAGHIQGSPATVSNNCVWQSGNPASSSGDIKANPLFVNETTRDYHLQSGSPCIGKGVVFDAGTPLATQTPPPATLTRTPTASRTATKTSIPPSATATPSLDPISSLTFSPVVETLTPTFTPVPPILVPTQTPSENLCARIVWNRPFTDFDLGIRPSASLSNISDGAYTYNRVIPIEAVVTVGPDTWAQVNRGQFFAIKIGATVYSKIVPCQ